MNEEQDRDCYNIISLFSGALGLDLGFERAGCNICISQDIDPWCVKTAVSNGYKCISGDIRTLIFKDPECDFLLKPTGLSKKDIFAVIGGPPCQSFSTAGRRRSTNDPRGGLFADFCHVVRTINPRFFVMENVKGLLSAAREHLPIVQRNSSTQISDEQRLGSAFEVVLKTLNGLGYKTIYGVLDAVHYGVPQFRERLIIIGSRDGEDIFLPTPTHFHKHQDATHRWKTLRDAIVDLEDSPGPCARFADDRIMYLKLIPQGGNWKDLPKEMIRSAMGGAYESGGGKVGFYRRLDYDQPSPTLITSPAQKATMLCHPTQNRPLSVKEYGSIQQFPGDWRIEGRITDCYRQIGNAVPVGLGRAIAQVLLSVAKGDAEVITKRTRGTSVHKKLIQIQNSVVNGMI
ncbi:MAG: DNA cytosine methyltransferase [Dehalococcoidia bacterium]